jgi:hypothetical protein
MRSLLLTHDLSCVIGDLAKAASRYDPTKGFDRRLHDLAVAAVAFTIQLAIDQPGNDPDALRALERALIAKLPLVEP